ncbi:MAG: M61 family peptidase, partial [Bacteroidia bacterium]|nr:M61 family peptidase [Bacteroidia bacterium]
MKYSISFPKPASGFIEIKLEIKDINFDKVQLQLPSWRPGRYELSNFARNIRSWKAIDKKGNNLNFEKLNKDLWEVETSNTDTVIIEYDYYTDSIDAGNCYSSDEQLYVNPIHCCLYDPNKMDETCELFLDIPKNWKVATGLKKHRGNKYSASNYHRFVDSPFICSAGLQHNSYKVANRKFNIWFQGECKPEWNRIIRDFRKFTAYQLKVMKSFPVDEFHFLVQITPYKKYHGVEHLNNTVLALGPGYDLMTSLYKELLG